MAPKRKLDSASQAPPKSDRPRKDSERPQKKLRKDLHNEKAPPEKVKSKPAAPAVQSSVLQEEERAFPRGGGSALTPVEHKQIQIQATKDALFEENGPKRSRDDAGSGDESDGETISAAKVASKKRKKVKTKAVEAQDDTEPRIRVEGLKFKRLAPGSMVLGQVTKITTNEVILDLPNNLMGHVSITDISHSLTERLGAVEDAGTDAAEDINLEDLFSIGQFLRACIISTLGAADGADSKSRKRIQLTLDPLRTNPGIDSSEVRSNCTLQATVASIEDHGIIMDMGFTDKSVKGFMSSKEIPQGREYSDMQKGAVYLCMVTGISSNGKVIKLSANHSKMGDLRKSNVLVDAPTVNALSPGTAVEVLISQLSTSTIGGQIIGLMDASADIIHAGAASRKADLMSKYKVGDKIKARVLFNIADAPTPVLGVSVLSHVLSLSSPLVGKEKQIPLKAYPIGTIIEDAKIVNVESGLGVFAGIGLKDAPAFVHISRLSDARVEAPSETDGPYRSGTTHRARIIGYNAVDGLYLASFEKSVVDQKFLRVEDVPVGEVVKGTVEKLVFNAKGGCGLLVNLAKGITGLVPELHLADIHLQHPERKFREGMTVTTRVLSTESERGQIRLTLKKSLINTKTRPWTDYGDIVEGLESLGTVLTLDSKGALVQFFGDVKGFLPISEMSDTFVEDARTRFKIGQVITVRAISIDASVRRMTISCRSASAKGAGSESIAASLKHGQLVSGTVSQTSEDVITLNLNDIDAQATLPVVHLTDGSEKKNASAAKQKRVGQTLRDLVVIEIFPTKRAITVSSKPSLVADAKAGKAQLTLAELEEGETVHGFVSNITDKGIFIQTIGRLSSLIPRSQISAEKQLLPDFGKARGDSVSARVLSVDLAGSRFTCSLKPPEDKPSEKVSDKKLVSSAYQVVTNPVDEKATSVADYTIGKTTVARITSAKDTQLNVQLADNVQGRIDVSEVFSKWEDISDRKHPLRTYRAKSTLPVRILGIHDARSHRFLPISHRGGKVPVFELSAKLSREQSLETLEQLEVGSWYTGFVNNVTDSVLWISLSPSVRGRIERMEASEDISVAGELEANFPLGSALKVRIKNIDLKTRRLDLSAKAISTQAAFTLETLSDGAVVTGRVTKVTERSMLVELEPGLVGQVGLTELADDYSLSNPTEYMKNDVVRVCVLSVDRANKRITLSTRPSKVLSSSLAVKDPQISDVSQVKVNDIVRGFVKNVAEVGLFVALSYDVTAFVRVSELSDSYMKDWKSAFEVDRLVTGKVISVDAATKQVQLSLKESVVSTEYVPKLTYNNMEVGMVVAGKIRKVEEYGAFIVVDNSNNVSGLAHRSEIAERRIRDVRDFYEEGDVVKAKVLKVNKAKGQISLGLKASYFENASDDESMEGGAMLEDNDEDDHDRQLDDDNEEDEEGGVNLDLNGADDGEDASEDEEEQSVAGRNAEDRTAMLAIEGLDAGGFDWSGKIQQDRAVSSNTPLTKESASSPTTARKSLRTEPQADLTGDLDASSPQTSSDFERLLLGSRNNSNLWLQYMAFYAGQGSLDEARVIAERAIKEIDIKFQDEKLNIWLAYLNLEVNYGAPSAVDTIFARACEYADARTVNERLASIYIQSGKLAEADAIYNGMLKKKDWNKSPDLWVNYAHFLFDDSGSPERGRELLSRADQVLVNKQDPSDVQTKNRRDLISKFAELEFKCRNGDAEQGRNAFEKLVDAYPKRWDVWDRYVQMEVAHGDDVSGENVRSLYERMTSLPQKGRRATYAFKKWLEFEETVDDGEGFAEKDRKRKRIEHVKAKAADVADKLRKAREE